MQHHFKTDLSLTFIYPAPRQRDKGISMTLRMRAGWVDGAGWAEGAPTGRVRERAGQGLENWPCGTAAVKKPAEQEDPGSWGDSP